MCEWKLSGGNLTLFPAAPASSPQLSALEIFRSVWGNEPDNFQRQPTPLGPTFAQGRQGSIVASCTVQPVRVDFNLAPVQISPVVPGLTSLPYFEDARQVQIEFTRILSAIADGKISGEYSRVALTIQFRAQAANSSEANKLLTKALPKQYHIDLTDEENVLIQVNSPYINKEAGNIKVNCVTKWSVDKIQVLTIAVPVTPTQVVPPISGTMTIPETSEFTTASVSFEHNNFPTNVVLSIPQLSAILRQALDQSIEAGRQFGFTA